MIEIINIDTGEGSRFDEEIVRKPAFIKYYADWCGHCQKLKPEWEKLEKELTSSKFEGDFNIINLSEEGAKSITSNIINKYSKGKSN